MFDNLNENSYGIVNASNGGLDSQGKRIHTPKQGYDGHVVLASSGDWYGEDMLNHRISLRTSILFHELAENYNRTDKLMNYAVAHEAAKNRECNNFHTKVSGTIIRADKDHPTLGGYYKGEHKF